MFLTMILIILSLTIDGLIFYFSGLWSNLSFLWLPFLLFPFLYFGLFALLLIILFITSLFIDKTKERKEPNRFFLFIVNEVNHQLIFLSGTRIKKIGFDKLPKDGHYMITFNHISNFDPMIIMDVLKKYNIICISKKENLKTPIMGAFIQKAGYIPIDRQDLRQTLKMFRKAVHYSQDLNYSICVAPEGTRSKTLELLPFHSGTYRLPLKAEMGIIEIYLENTNLIHKNFPFKLTKVKMEVMDIIEYDSIKDDCTQTIAENARDRYVQTIKKREEQTK